MKIIQSEISDVLIIEPDVFDDNRGFFYESWNERNFANAGLNLSFVQDNHSRSTKHTLRGMHYQIKNSQGKLIRCTSGEVYDVVADLRSDQPTFGEWIGVQLSDENKRMLYVPPGFAHGFYVVSSVADFQYKCTDYYFPEYECCIIWDDTFLDIKWPLPINIKPVLSSKDLKGLSFHVAPHF